MQLDEWWGIPSESPASCRRYIQERVQDPLGIPDARVVAFSMGVDGTESGAQQSVIAMDVSLAALGPLDVLILG